ncbi:MAG TPA: hypothetical protein VGB91_12500 [Rhizomicrobium sp.]
MPCCTLIAFVLSQCGIAAGAVRTMLFGRTVPAAGAADLRWPILALALFFELGIGAASASYILTAPGRTQAAQSFGAAWHVCASILGGGR